VAETPPTAQERMAAHVRTSQGRALYARRQVIVEPVCGQSKEARGGRRFLRRGLEHIRGEGRLVCLTHHLRKLWRYAYAPITVEADAMAPWRPTMPLVRTAYLQ
jgi:hypothetical protein